MPFNFNYFDVILILIIFILNTILILKFRIKFNVKINLIFFNLIHVFLYFFIFPSFYEFYNDTSYYYEHLSQNLNFIDFIESEFTHIKSIRLPSIGVNVFNYIIYNILNTTNIYIIGYIHIVLFHISLYFLSKIFSKKKLSPCVIVLLFISPSIFTYSMPLLKDLFTLTLVIFATTTFISKRYVLFLFLVVILFSTRIYGVMAILPTIFSIYFLENYMKNRENDRVLYMTMLHIVTSVFLLILIRGNSFFDLGQSVNIYLATLFAPVITIDNIFSLRLAGIQLLESSFTLIVAIFIIFLLILHTLSKGKIYLKIPLFFIFFVLLSFSYNIIIISEAVVVFHSLENTDYLSLGAQATRLKLPILVIYYIFAYLVFMEMKRLNKKIKWI
jgi:hypothetical protein